MTWVGAHDRRAVRGGKSVIGVYLGHASIGSSYGAAGSLVVFLVWIYYSSLIMFLGAEITFAYAWASTAPGPAHRACGPRRPMSAS